MHRNEVNGLYMYISELRFAAVSRERKIFENAGGCLSKTIFMVNAAEALLPMCNLTLLLAAVYVLYTYRVTTVLGEPITKPILEIASAPLPLPTPLRLFEAA